MALDTISGAGVLRSLYIKRGIPMKIEITRATIVNQKRATVGEVVTTDEYQARTLISLGKAVPVADAPQAENREEDLEKKVTKRRGRPPKNAE